MPDKAASGAITVATAAKVPSIAEQSDCCERRPVLRVRVESGKQPIRHPQSGLHRTLFIVCDDPEHWLWAHGCCRDWIDIYAR